MACFIIGAGSFYGLPVSVQRTDMVIAADGGWYTCRENGITPTLLVADFDSLDAAPAFDHILRLPVEKDDTDMIRAVKEGFDRGEREFHLLGGMGGHRTDHTVANMQTLAYIARRGGQGWLYGNGERFTAICDGGEITLTAGQNSVFSVFCLGADAEGVTIENAKYPLTDAVLTAVETRSSSPVRIVRDNTYQTALRGLYPCGEGAGYAGGILSAAADGMRCAEQIIKEITQHG